MLFSLPTDIPLITDAELNVLQDCFEVREGYLYFHRVQHPNRATVYYGVDLLHRHLKKTEFRIVLFDFTEREMVDHAQMRYLVDQVKSSQVFLLVTHLIIVLDGNPFRQIAANFFLNVFYRDRSTRVHLCQTLEEAVELAQQFVSET